jgi:predicted O-methyltransferase YrrM
MKVLNVHSRQLVKTLLRRAGYEVSPIVASQSLRERNPDITAEEWKIYSRVRPFTMVSLERILANVRAVDYVVRSRIPGDIVECGVWRGGSSMAMALALARHGDTSRRIWMYDTYAGMTDPTSADVSRSGASAAALLAAAKQYEAPECSLVWAYASLDDVRANMEATGYPLSRTEFVKGPVELTLPGAKPDQIAVLRIDTDWYESTKLELVHLYPRLSPGGVLIIDDYGDWQGARRAVDEYFADLPLFLNRVDYTGRLAIKQHEASAEASRRASAS